MSELYLKSRADIVPAAKKIIALSGNKKIFCLYGELGTGKTTLVKELCKQLGVQENGSSPTFSIVNEYRLTTPLHQATTCYHFDLYRLPSETEFFDIGYEDYLFSHHYCFIEWPEKVEHLLPKERMTIRIRFVEKENEAKQEERIVTIS
jgi:tRNA threonylcarbamoyladenosine biosynthesis protein TsaE